MDGRRARLLERSVLDKLPRLTKPAREPVGHAEPQQLTIPWAALLGIGWPLAFMAAVALEPAPVDPEAAAPLLIEVASLVFLAALVTTVVCATLRHPAAAMAGVVAGLLGMVFTITCPVSGHHAFGLWWVGQLAVTGAMLGVSLAALGRRSRTTT